MNKQKLESILVEYGVPFTDALADRLLKEFSQERQGVLEKIEDEIWNLKENCTASDYLGCGILDIIEKYKERGKNNAL